MRSPPSPLTCDDVPKFPDPPASHILARIAPDFVTIGPSSLLWRIHFRGGPHPTDWDAFRHFGPIATSRFDHHLHPLRQQERGIVYAAENWETCVAEVFQQTRTIDRHFREPWLAGFHLAADVRLLDLTGAWPTRAGASMAINSGPRPRAQRWSAACYDAYPAIYGLRYASSMLRNEPAFALYERAASALPTTPTVHLPLTHPRLLELLANVATDIGYDLL